MKTFFWSPTFMEEHPFLSSSLPTTSSSIFSAIFLPTSRANFMFKFLYSFLAIQKRIHQRSLFYFYLKSKTSEILLIDLYFLLKTSLSKNYCDNYCENNNEKHIALFSTWKKLLYLNMCVMFEKKDFHVLK